MLYCLHCGYRRRDRGSTRRLCWVCRQDAAIRDRYPPLPSIYARANDEPIESDYTQAPSSTSALPGSAEKIEVMVWRFAHKFHVAHPEDALGVSDKAYSVINGERKRKQAGRKKLHHCVKRGKTPVHRRGGIKPDN